MKLKTLALLAASAIGVNANALDLNEYTERQSAGGYKPLIHESDYMFDGRLYSDTGVSFDLIYDLTTGGERLIDTDGSFALGYSQAENGRFFLCQILECNIEEKRNYIAGHIVKDRGHTIPRNTNLFSKYGRALIYSRQNNNTFYTATVLDVSTGSHLASFKIKANAVQSVISDETFYYVGSTTGITNEQNFKLLTADDDIFKVVMLSWNESLKRLDGINLYLPDNTEINDAYPNGLVPIAISDPKVVNGKSTYTIALGTINEFDGEHAYFSEVIWGDVQIENAIARFIEEPVSSFSDARIFASSLTTSSPIFHKSGYFTFGQSVIDMRSKSDVVEKLDLKWGDRTFYPFISSVSDRGEISIRETTPGASGYKLFYPSRACR